MKEISPLQIDNLGKSFSLLFIFVTLAWCVASFLTFGDVLIGWPILALNLVLAAVLSWFFYKHRYHTIFSYDEEGFELQRGQLKTSARWEEFSTVSLVHLGRGRFAVRLYKTEEDFIDLPASALRLDPSALRFEVMGFISGRASDLPESREKHPH